MLISQNLAKKTKNKKFTKIYPLQKQYCELLQLFIKRHTLEFSKYQLLK